ncbi:hypothetical protein B0T16DRAFT_453873 [Cercophora newfieldiana]|uniref:Chromosome transmission fidelity protein 4 n=1 Tax=Cercophora newfieldiana TaxID=92897 RepID=A0AA39YGD0_9PEZI|nr:hypothetical protein B0T16DRAFT_453873 [Cercophora newfieldiana]
MSKPTKILRSAQAAPASAPRQPPAWIPRQLPEATRITSTTATAPALPTQSTTSPKLPKLPSQPTLWFSANLPLQSQNLHKPLGTHPDKPPDDRKVKLGKTLRILQSQLPTLLQSPLPSEVLSPNITLHLFPSTHPHLPAVTGRVAYIAALWSSPIAWNRIPLIGNVRLEILSERMVAQPLRKQAAGAVGEQLVVRWRTVGKKGGLLPLLNGNGSGKEESKAPVGDALPAKDKAKEFTGLFFFDFDSEGRILSHTIEHVQEGGQWEKGVGAKVVGLTDWLLGGMKGNEGTCPAFSRKGR